MLEDIINTYTEVHKEMINHSETKELKIDKSEECKPLKTRMKKEHEVYKAIVNLGWSNYQADGNYPQFVYTLCDAHRDHLGENITPPKFASPIPQTPEKSQSNRSIYPVQAEKSPTRNSELDALEFKKKNQEKELELYREL